MKTISIFQVQDINNLLKERQFDFSNYVMLVAVKVSILNVLVKKPILIYYAM